jgi:hypothetical protein
MSRSEGIAERTVNSAFKVEDRNYYLTRIFLCLFLFVCFSSYLERRPISSLANEREWKFKNINILKKKKVRATVGETRVTG